MSQRQHFYLPWMMFCTTAFISLFAVYGRSLPFFFYQDDFILLEFVSQKSLIDYVGISFTKPSHLLPLNFGVVFRPLPHYVYFQVIHRLFNLNPAPFRLVNLLIYFLCGVLIAKYGQMISRKPDVGFVAGIIFIVNRVYFEPLYWISANNEIALTFSVLVSIISFLRSLDSARFGRFYLGISCTGLLLALLSKETAIVTPTLIAASVLLRIDRRSVQSRLMMCAKLWPHVILVVIFVAVRAPFILYALDGGGESYYAIPSNIIVRIVTDYLWGFWWNLETFVEPWRMMLDSLTQTFSVFQPLVISIMSFILIGAIATYMTVTNGWANRANPIWLGLFWFFVSALPALVTGVLAAYLFSLSAVGFVVIFGYLIDLIATELSIKWLPARRLLPIVFLGVSIVSASLVVQSLEKTTWPAKFMPLAESTIKVARQSLLHQPVNNPVNKIVCLVGFPYAVWWPERAQPAFRMFIDPEINVRELENSNSNGDTCPGGSLQLTYVDNTIVTTWLPEN